MEIRRIQLHYLFSANCYLLKSDKGQYLVDTGLEKRRSQLYGELQDAGSRPGDLKLVIVTHGHTDHVGNVACLREKYGAKIAMHREDFPMVTSGNMFVGARGITVKLLGFLTKISGLSNYERFTPDIFLTDGQNLREYGLDAAVIHNPGHSKGSISILTASGDLFCGDVFGNTKKPERTTLIDDQGAFNASVERLKALTASTVYPGHGEPFSFSLTGQI